MSKVMTENKVQVRYAFSREFIGQEWVRTGQFVGYGRDLALDCDTPEKRALIVALGWHEDDPYRPRNYDMNILGKYQRRGYRGDLHDLQYHIDYDHELTVDEIWDEIKRMVSEKEAAEKAAANGDHA